MTEPSLNFRILNKFMAIVVVEWINLHVFYMYLQRAQHMQKYPANLDSVIWGSSIYDCIYDFIL